MTLDKTTPLQQMLATKIVAWLKQEQVKKGFKLTEASIAQRFNVSRTPVRAALTFLQSKNIAETLPYKGFALKVDAAEIADFAPPESSESQQEALYLAILKDLLFGQLSTSFSEAELQKRYQASRHEIHQVLLQLEADAIVFSGPGYKWLVQAGLNEVESHFESYRFRLIFEPAALLEPNWRLDVAAFEQLQHRHLQAIAQPDTISAKQLFELSADFHELLASCSHNRFLLAAMKQQNRLRRATDQVSMKMQTNVVKACQRRLDIMAALLNGQQNLAKELLTGLLENDIRVMQRTYQQLQVQ